MVQEYELLASIYKKIFLFRNTSDIHPSWRAKLSELEKSKASYEQQEHEMRAHVQSKFGLTDEQMSDYLDAVVDHEKKVLALKLGADKSRLHLKNFFPQIDIATA